MNSLRDRLYRFLRSTERYTKTDMVYLLKNGGWLVMGQLSGLIFSLGLAFVFANYAAQDTYGNYKYILAVASVLGVLSLSDIGTAVTRAVARGEEGTLRQGFSLSLRWSGAILIVGGVTSAYYWLHGNAFVSASLALAAITLPLINSFSLYDAFLTGRQAFRTNTLYTIVSNAVTTLALIVTLLFFSERALILIAVYFITTVASDSLWYAITVRQVSNEKADPHLGRYSAHLSLMRFIDTVTEKIDAIVVFILLGPVQLAVYAFAIAIPEQFRGIMKSLATISLARFSMRPVDEIRSTIRRRLVLLASAAGAATLTYIAIAPSLFHHLFPAYLESIPYSRWYALIIIPTAVAAVLITILQAHQKTKALYFSNNLGQVMLIVLLPLLTYIYGIPGAITAHILYRFTVLGFSIWQFSNVGDDRKS